jgi:hypothetical protein
VYVETEIIISRQLEVNAILFKPDGIYTVLIQVVQINVVIMA